MSEINLWELHHNYCPWYDYSKCSGQVSYNQHVNDPRFKNCFEGTCPILFWVNILKRRVSEQIKEEVRNEKS
jgi:hypothetical protein